MARDIDRTLEALRRHLPGVTGLSPLTTGHSNETYLIGGLDQILRLPPHADPLMQSHGVIAQARIYETLGRAPGGPPVPHVSHVCEDAGPLGDPFFVMARAAGEAVHDVFLQPWFVEADDAFRERMCGAWVRAIAGLARLAPIDPFGAPVTPGEEARRWRNAAEAADCAALVAEFDRLLARPAPLSGPPAPVHGDPKLANLLFSDGALTAVLDWELGYNGEPLADLGYMLYFFEHAAHPAGAAQLLSGMWARDAAIAAWSEAAGRSAEGVGWHEIAAVGKMAAILADGYNLYASGKSGDVRFERWKGRLDVNIGIMRSMLDADRQFQ